VKTKNKNASNECSTHSPHSFDFLCCRHNLNYWNFGNYVGIGPGAASRIMLSPALRYSFQVEKSPKKWMNHWKDLKEFLGQVEELKQHENLQEFLILGLRKFEGISKAQFKKVLQKDFQEVREKKNRKKKRERTKARKV
jgi:oxygen-independent coproporphyrinogen-3 oxidase